jgi:hypothetical protein
MTQGYTAKKAFRIELDMLLPLILGNRLLATFRGGVLTDESSYVILAQ